MPRCRPRSEDVRQGLNVKESLAAPARPHQPAVPAECGATVRDAILVLPLKILRGRPDAEFLAFSLPDAIASSLADHPTIAVRSPLAVQRHGGAEADLEMLAEVMSARFALTGTPACVDERIGIRLQLLAIPAGRVLWSTLDPRGSPTLACPGSSRSSTLSQNTADVPRTRPAPRYPIGTAVAVALSMRLEPNDRL